MQIPERARPISRPWGRYFLILLALAFLSSASSADITLPALISEGMVVQRGLPIHIWGRADAGEQVTVKFRSETKSATADVLGQWHIYLNPAEAGGPYDLTIAGRNTVVLHNVLVGDVWVASGQSNMEFPVRRLKDGVAGVGATSFPQIHVLQVKKVHSEFPLDDLSTKGWQVSSASAIEDFSAIGFLFAREIHEREKIPVGIIDATWGGTVVEAWASYSALAEDSQMGIFADRGRMVDSQLENQLKGKREKVLTDQAIAEGKPAPKFPWHPEPFMWEPSVLFNGMISPLTPYGIRGVIWYQGESNSQLTRAPHYQKAFETLIRDWRKRWNVGDFPFFYVQIANFTSTNLEDWPTIRDAQRKALELRNTAMAVTTDIGNPDDVHPLNKQDVAKRLALAARANVYGEKVEYSGPLFRELTREEHGLRAWFDHASGLRVQGSVAQCFEVAGDDEKYHPATFEVNGTSIVVRSPEVPEPVTLRHAWQNSPECVLFNQEGLPGSPFQASLPLFH